MDKQLARERANEREMARRMMGGGNSKSAEDVSRVLMSERDRIEDEIREDLYEQIKGERKLFVEKYP